MYLKGKEIKALLDALESAFVDKSEFERFMDFELGVKLSTIGVDAPYVGLKDTCYKTILWANANGKIKSLIEKANEVKGENSILKKFYQELSADNRKVKIMFVGASPRNDSFIRADVEVRQIEDRIEKTKYRDFFSFIPKTAMRATELQEHLQRIAPHIIHFSGHGTDIGELEFESEIPNNPIPIKSESIAETIRLAPKELRLAFFNACCSVKAAQATVKYINTAIGMDGEIGNEAANVFSAEFYSAICEGCSVGHAYEQAINQLNVLNINGSDIPKLFSRSGINPLTLFFAG